MITSFILVILSGLIFIITSPLRLFADVDINSNFITALTEGAKAIKAFDSFVPVTSLLIIFGLIITIEVVIAKFKGVVFAVKKIPFIN